jgi:hypothetical protein
MDHVTQAGDDAQVRTGHVAMEPYRMAFGVRDAVVGPGDEMDRNPEFTVATSQARHDRNHETSFFGRRPQLPRSEHERSGYRSPKGRRYGTRLEHLTQQPWGQEPGDDRRDGIAHNITDHGYRRHREDHDIGSLCWVVIAREQDKPAHALRMVEGERERHERAQEWPTTTGDSMFRRSNARMSQSA